MGDGLRGELFLTVEMHPKGEIKEIVLLISGLIPVDKNLSEY